MLATQPATPAELFAFLDHLQIPHQTVSHQPLFTVEQARACQGRVSGGHTKNLFLRDKRRAFFLVVALEHAVIELGGLHRRLGATGRFSFGSTSELQQLLGVEPGSVTPFAAINDTSGQVAIVLDAAMMAHDVLNYHPLTNTMTTSIARSDILKFLHATGHPARIEKVSEDTVAH